MNTAQKAAKIEQAWQAHLRSINAEEWQLHEYAKADFTAGFLAGQRMSEEARPSDRERVRALIATARTRQLASAIRASSAALQRERVGSVVARMRVRRRLARSLSELDRYACSHEQTDQRDMPEDFGTHTH